MHGVQTYYLLLPVCLGMCVCVCLSVCVSVCLLVTTNSCAKTAEPVEIPFAVLTRVGRRNRVLDGNPNLPIKR